VKKLIFEIGQFMKSFGYRLPLLGDNRAGGLSNHWLDFAKQRNFGGCRGFFAFP